MSAPRQRGRPTLEQLDGVGDAALLAQASLALRAAHAQRLIAYDAARVRGEQAKGNDHERPMSVEQRKELLTAVIWPSGASR